MVVSLFAVVFIADSCPAGFQGGGGAAAGSDVAATAAANAAAVVALAVAWGTGLMSFKINQYRQAGDP